MKATQEQRAYRQAYYQSRKDYYRQRYLERKSIYNAQSSEWRRKHRQEYNALIRKWRNTNPENRAKTIASSKQWKIDNPDRARQLHREHSKRYYAKYRDRELMKARARRMKKITPEYLARENLRGELWRKNNPEKRRAIMRDWNRRNPEKRRAYALNETHKRRARKRSTSVNPKSISIFITGVKAKSFATCYYCQRGVSTNGIHFDHIVPLCKGGAHSVENLCVSCAECNQRKHASAFGQWIKLGQQLLEV